MSDLRTYPPEWPAVSFRTKAEAGWRCVRCGHPAEGPCDQACTHDPAVRDHRILTVHHLDGVKANLAWWNLAALCQRCHLQVQGRVKMDQTYLHPHTPWFWPYVAGFYAATVGGEQLSRAEVLARLPELLALGQPHLADHYLELQEATT